MQDQSKAKRDRFVLNLSGVVFAGAMFHSFANNPELAATAHGPGSTLFLAVVCAIAGVVWTSVFKGIFKAVAKFNGRQFWC